MLPFYYTVLILVLSSSVMAMPVEPSVQPNGECKLLRGNTDKRLQNTVWGWVILSETQETPGTTWSDNAKSLDVALRFVVTDVGSVQGVELSKVKRALLPNKRRGPMPTQRKHNEYRVVRPVQDNGATNQGPAKRYVVVKPMPINEESRQYLDDSYWGLNSKILGRVSASLVIDLEILAAWPTLRFTAKFGPLQERDYPHRMEDGSHTSGGGPICNL